MTLKEYLKEHNLTVADFSIISRISLSILYRIMKEYNISRSTQKKLLKKTNGKVFYDKIYKPNTWRSSSDN